MEIICTIWTYIKREDMNKDMIRLEINTESLDIMLGSGVECIWARKGHVSDMQEPELAGCAEKYF